MILVLLLTLLIAIESVTLDSIDDFTRISPSPRSLASQRDNDRPKYYCASLVGYAQLLTIKKRPLLATQSVDYSITPDSEAEQAQMATTTTTTTAVSAFYAEQVYKLIST